MSYFTISIVLNPSKVVTSFVFFIKKRSIV